MERVPIGSKCVLYVSDMEPYLNAGNCIELDLVVFFTPDGRTNPGAVRIELDYLRPDCDASTKRRIIKSALANLEDREFVFVVVGVYRGNDRMGSAIYRVKCDSFFKAVEELVNKDAPQNATTDASDEIHLLSGGSGHADNLGDAPLIIDGSNVVRQNDRYGWRVLKTLLGWVKDKGVNYHLYFDASIAHLEMDAAGKEFIKDQIADTDHTTKCPSRDEADKFILYRADKTGGRVISNDGYKPWESKYSWIGARNNTDDVRRVHKFTIEGDMLSVPDLDIFDKIADA